MIVTRELEVMYRCHDCEAKADVIDDLRCWCSTCWLKKEKKKDSLSRISDYERESNVDCDEGGQFGMGA